MSNATERPSSRGDVVALSAAVLFLALLALLGTRVAQGRDPALHRRTAAVPPRRVLVRRIYERRVIVHLPPAAPTPAETAAQQVSAAAGFGALATTRTS